MVEVKKIDLSKRKTKKAENGEVFYVVPKGQESVFDDGYDLLAEREYLISVGIEKPEIEGPDVDHDEVVRWCNFSDRIDEIKSRAGRLRRRNHAENSVNDRDAVQTPGRLETQSFLNISTRQVWRLWLGQVSRNVTLPIEFSDEEIKSELNSSAYRVVSKSEKNMVVQKIGFPGIQSCAGALSKAWFATNKDNPFIEYFLIKVDEKIDDCKKYLVEKVNEYQKMFDEKKKIGFEINVLKSTAPVKAPFIFSSSYGTRVADLMLLTDQLILMIKTAKYMGILTKAQELNEVWRAANKIRSFNTYVVSTKSRLFDCNEIMAMSRSEGINKPSTKAMKLLKLCDLHDLPANVYTGERKPADFRPIITNENKKKRYEMDDSDGLFDDIKVLYRDNPEMLEAFSDDLDGLA